MAGFTDRTPSTMEADIMRATPRRLQDPDVQDALDAMAKNIAALIDGNNDDLDNALKRAGIELKTT